MTSCMWLTETLIICVTDLMWQAIHHTMYNVKWPTQCDWPKVTPCVTDSMWLTFSHCHLSVTDKKWFRQTILDCKRWLTQCHCLCDGLNDCTDWKLNPISTSSWLNLNIKLTKLHQRQSVKWLYINILQHLENCILIEYYVQYSYLLR